MATKLALIDSDLLMKLLDRHVDRAAPPANPILREMNTIDNQMRGTLDSPSLSALSKSQKINSLLAKHDNFSRQYENQPPPTVAVQPPDNPEQQDQDYWYSKTVNSVPNKLQKKAKDLLDHMKASKKIQWDRDGRVVVDNETVPNTNILDLVNSVTRHRTSVAPPTGSQQFLAALDQIYTPRELMPNADSIRKETRGSARIRLSRERQEEYQIPSKPTKRKRPRKSLVDYGLWENAR